jgi:uncharacterized protein YecE (DUF72 family)
MITKSIYKSNLLIDINTLKELLLIEQLYKIKNKIISEENIDKIENSLKKIGINKKRSNNDVYIIEVFNEIKEKYDLENIDFNNIYDIYISILLKEKYGNICNYDGYILENTIEIIKRSYGKLLYNGNILYNISYSATILIPHQGKLFKNCIIQRPINENYGLICRPEEHKEAIVIIVPFIFLSDINKHKIINEKTNKPVDIITLDSYFEIHDRFIKVIGKIPDTEETNKLYDDDELNYENCIKYFESFNIEKKEYHEDDGLYKIEQLSKQELDPSANIEFEDTNNSPVKNTSSVTDKNQVVEHLYSPKYINNYNICWINSLLQLLNYNHSFKKFIIDYISIDEIDRDIEDQYNELLNSLKILINQKIAKKEIIDIYLDTQEEKITAIVELEEIQQSIENAKQEIKDFSEKNVMFIQNKTIELLQYLLDDTKIKTLIDNEKNEASKTNNKERDISDLINDKVIELVCLIPNIELGCNEDSGEAFNKIYENLVKEIIGKVNYYKDKNQYKINSGQEKFIEDKSMKIILEESFITKPSRQEYINKLLQPFTVREIHYHKCKEGEGDYEDYNITNQNLIIIRKNSDEELFNIHSYFNKQEDKEMAGCDKQFMNHTESYEFLGDYILIQIGRDSGKLVDGVYKQFKDWSNVVGVEKEITQLSYSYFENNSLTTTSVRCDLRAICLYHGAHYTTIAKRIDGWYEFNDNIYNKISENYEDINAIYNKNYFLLLFRINRNNDNELLEKDMNDLYGVELSSGLGIPIPMLGGADASFELSELPTNVFIGTQGYEFNKDLENNYWVECYNKWKKNEENNILEFYSQYFKILELNSKIDNIDFSKITNNKFSIVININNYNKLNNDIFIEKINKLKEDNNIIILKFSKLDYDVELLSIIDYIYSRLEDYDKLLFEFCNNTYYVNNEIKTELKNIIKKYNYGIVLLDINSENININSFNNEDYLNNLLSQQKKIIYIKLYGAIDLYQGTYRDDFLQKIKLTETQINEKEIYYIFANVETNKNDKKLKVILKDGKKKCDENDMPSSINNAMELMKLMKI